MSVEAIQISFDEVAAIFREVKLTSTQASGPCIWWYFAAGLIVMYSAQDASFSLYMGRRRRVPEDEEAGAA